MSKTYSFVEQLEEGQHYESVLDDYFSQWYVIDHSSKGQQRKGIDRIFTLVQEPEKVTLIEYKADSKTQDTGNVFVETYSVYEMGKYGWAWTSTADVLVYLCIPDTIYMVYPHVIRDHLDFWKRTYGEKSVKNKGYTSRGIPVPEIEFAKVCFKVRRLR